MSVNVILTPVRHPNGIEPLRLLVEKFHQHVVQVIRVDALNPGSSNDLVLGEHIFIIVVKEPNSIAQLTAFVNEFSCSSGGKEPRGAPFREMMNCLTKYGISPVIYSARNDDEKCRHQWNTNGWGNKDEIPHFISCNESSDFSPEEYEIFTRRDFRNTIAQRVDVWRRLILCSLSRLGAECVWEKVW